jgi:DNA helicase-2/ATP-dependent DNA helicase PcrA
MAVRRYPEQDAIVEHPPDQHGRVLAGPGTGKSSTVLRLAEAINSSDPPLKARLVTFTRAATAELVDKIREQGHTVDEPTTLHSFALSVLMRNQEHVQLPRPLRLPDDWEVKNLIQPDLARRLREQGHQSVTTRTIGKLEHELASQWDSLNPQLVLIADLDPALRNAYVATWMAHRGAFGYSLFAEIPYSAHHLLEDHARASIPNVDVLIVDEFQDLNAAEIALVRTLAHRRISIVAVGDDDQSIYGFRMADPAGIRDLNDHLPGLIDYPLTTSLRCGTAILTAARTLIEATPGRPPKPGLVPGPDNPVGEFQYLKFSGAAAETNGVVRLIAYLRARGIEPDDIAVLMRSDYLSAWSGPVRLGLTNAGIPSTDVEAALEPLAERNARRLLAIARLVTNRHDGLAWWALLDLTAGISSPYVNQVADEALAQGETFAIRLMRIQDEPPAGASGISQSNAVQTVRTALSIVEETSIEGVPVSDTGWATWLLELADALGIGISDDFRDLALKVGQLTPQEEGLDYFLNQLEPVTKDLALRTEGVAIMTMTRSKGLTFRAAIVMGVEEGVVPLPTTDDVNEERRLLYVAMTRPREYLYLTMADERTGPTARTGAPNVGRSRGRCPFFHPLGASFSPNRGLVYLASIGA